MFEFVKPFSWSAMGPQLTGPEAGPNSFYTRWKWNPQSVSTVVFEACTLEERKLGNKTWKYGAGIE